MQNEKNNSDNEKRKIKIYRYLINLFFAFVNPVTIIIYLIIWGYFRFALPVINK